MKKIFYVLLITLLLVGCGEKKEKKENVGDVISNSNKAAQLKSVENLAEAIKTTAVMASTINEGKITVKQKDGEYTILINGKEVKKVEYSGERVYCQNIEYHDGDYLTLSKCFVGENTLKIRYDDYPYNEDNTGGHAEVYDPNVIY